MWWESLEFILRSLKSFTSEKLHLLSFHLMTEIWCALLSLSADLWPLPALFWRNSLYLSVISRLLVFLCQMWVFEGFVSLKVKRFTLNDERHVFYQLILPHHLLFTQLLGACGRFLTSGLAGTYNHSVISAEQQRSDIDRHETEGLLDFAAQRFSLLTEDKSACWNVKTFITEY